MFGPFGIETRARTIVTWLSSENDDYRKNRRTTEYNEEAKRWFPKEKNESAPMFGEESTSRRQRLCESGEGKEKQKRRPARIWKTRRTGKEEKQINKRLSRANNNKKWNPKKKKTMKISKPTKRKRRRRKTFWQTCDLTERRPTSRWYRERSRRWSSARDAQTHQRRRHHRPTRPTATTLTSSPSADCRLETFGFFFVYKMVAVSSSGSRFFS